MKTFEVELIEDGEDLILPLPQEVLDTLDLKEGDYVVWTPQEDGSVFLIKKSVSPEILSP
jgi:bifunctional DNA-binding transcriptional regulator/antitoxin component of YhaV-PrlF toxin-antitoxin module